MRIYIFLSPIINDTQQHISRILIILTRYKYTVEQLRNGSYESGFRARLDDCAREKVGHIYIYTMQTGRNWWFAQRGET